MIGTDAIIGAHAFITQDKHFAPNSLIVGLPAKVVRELTEEEFAAAAEADEYVAN